MPRRNRNALRGGVRQPRATWGQPAQTADEFAGLDHLLRNAWVDFAAELGAATDSSAVLADIYARAGASGRGCR